MIYILNKVRLPKTLLKSHCSFGSAQIRLLVERCNIFHAQVYTNAMR